MLPLGGAFGPARLVRVHIETGRRYPIRRHFADLRHQPLVDVEFGKVAVNRHCRAGGLTRLFLHCCSDSVLSAGDSDRRSVSDTMEATAPLASSAARKDMEDGIVEIRATGLGSWSSLALSPGRLTVLIGPNGAGKSHLLRALKLLALMRTGSLQRFVAESGGASALLHYGPKRTPALSLSIEFVQNSQRNRYEAELGYSAGDRLVYLGESVGYQSNSQAPMKMRLLGSGHTESELQNHVPSDVTARTVNFWLRNLTFFHFHDTSMRSALRSHARAVDDQLLRSDGSNLAAFLLRLKRGETEADRVAWYRVENYVRRIAPSLKELCPTPTVEGGESVRLDWIDDQDQRFGVHQLSDGTLRAIALITALAQPSDRLPKFLSIDEPELGLHPAAIGLVAELARSISTQTQILFATQSTAFLDYFEPTEVVVVERIAGASVLKRLDEVQLDAWLDDYSLSELFDKGVLGGRP